MGLLKSLSCDDRKHVTQRVGIPRARSTGDRKTGKQIKVCTQEKTTKVCTQKKNKGLYTGKNKVLYTGNDDKGLYTEGKKYDSGLCIQTQQRFVCR